MRTDARVIMVSGANRGIGRAVCAALHREGYVLSLGARVPENLGELLATMDDKRTMSHPFEARQATSSKEWVAATVRRFGRLDGVVNSAGILRSMSLQDSAEEALDEMWEVNVKGPLRLIRAAFAELKKSGNGRVVNIVSLSGKRVKSASIGGYAMTKHAAAALTHMVRYEGWEYGIRATSICPGFVATDMTAGVASIPREQMIQPESIGQLVASVLSLPNNASVAELPVNCVLESAF